MLGWNGSEWFAILMSAALKSTIVLGAAWVLAFLLRSRSAAARHLVWTAAAAAVLALPLLSISLPGIQLPVSTSILPASTGVVFRAIGLASADSPAVSPTVAIKPATPAPASPGRANPKPWLLLIWVAGTAVSLFRMAWAYVSLWRIRRSAPGFDDDGMTASLAQALEVPRAVQVLETPAGSMPMTFGFLRPAVFLPADSRQWSEERRRIVLLHEFAHVRRGDAATHLLARTAWSANWWNPLAWIAWREFLKERERAADDLVLTAGARASEYATHLLEVARTMQSAPMGAAAVAMARRSQLEGRLLAILDTRVNRTPIRGAATPAAAALLAALLVAPFAAVRAQDRPSPAVPPEVDATIRAAMSQKNHEILEHAASVYIDLRKYDTAQTLLESALTIRGEVSGQQSAAYAAGLVKLGDLASKRNQTNEAISFYTKAVSLGDRPEVARALVQLGIYAYGKRDYPQALDLLQRAIGVAPQGPQAGPAMTWMASVKETQATGNFNVPPTVSASGEPLPSFRTTTTMDAATGRYPLPGLPGATANEVEALLQKALSVEPDDSLDAASTMELYARFLSGQNRPEEAKQFAERASGIRVRKLAADAILNGGPSPSASGVMKVGGGVTAPVVLSKTDPAYTEVARAAKYQGTVLLYVEVGPDGMAHNMRIVRSLGLGLDEKAIEAVGKWHFRPGTKDGEPVTVAATIEVNFRLL